MNKALYKDILRKASLRAAHFLGLDAAQVAQIKTEAQLESEEKVEP